SVAWCSLGLATANEGDYLGGTRSFTIFSPTGDTVFSSGSRTEQTAVQLGHYPDRRSGARGTEPEALVRANFEGDEFLFLGCERSNLVLVYGIENGQPLLKQALPAGAGPESVTAIPERNLIAVGS